MIDGLLKIGDRVTVTVPKENREWGSKDAYPFPDGIEGTVCGFYDAVLYNERIGVLSRNPGTFYRHGAPSVWLPDGRVIKGLSDWWLELVDKDESERRLAEYRAKGGFDYHRDLIRLGDLPPTPFWEGDKVRVQGSSNVTSIYGAFPSMDEPEFFTIVGIDYHHLHEKTNAGTPYPAYRISDKLGGGWHTTATADAMELVERGNVWKYYNNQVPSFADLKDEASFFELVGQTEQVRNPANGLYSWTKGEVLEAIKNGQVHGFSAGNGFFGSGPHINAKRFRNEELGKRVAKATLEGFGIAA